ncbi:MAG: EF-hand domain-containing protein [Rhodocyclaceae bacterium]|jgi:Ca2+-binding EF-hand superfamily protein|nr:EF-hand domain-containing protein [Rhodocyclaceae bacterium]MBK6909079.1 EF-hand domain-containing protein [Rhodocyclaceae bacterium]
MSTIGSLSSMSGGFAMNPMGSRPPRPDASAMAEKLFAKLDSSGKGYIEQAGFTSALENVTSSSDATALFAELDADSDGKLTEQEFSSSLKALSEQLDQQFMSLRLQGGMPPPPPPPRGGGADEGFSKDELQSQLNAISSSQSGGDTQRASLISSVIENFDTADTDGNGKVSFAEAMALERSAGSESSTSPTSTASASASESSNQLRWMQQIVQLMRAYGLEQSPGGGTLNSVA